MANVFTWIKSKINSVIDTATSIVSDISAGASYVVERIMDPQSWSGFAAVNPSSLLKLFGLEKPLRVIQKSAYSNIICYLSIVAGYLYLKEQMIQQNPEIANSGELAALDIAMYTTVFPILFVKRKEDGVLFNKSMGKAMVLENIQQKDIPAYPEPKGTGMIADAISPVDYTLRKSIIWVPQQVLNGLSKLIPNMIKRIPGATFQLVGNGTAYLGKLFSGLLNFVTFPFYAKTTGDGFIDFKLSSKGLSTDHRHEECAKRDSYSFGLGASYYLTLAILSYLVKAGLNVESVFIADAIANVLNTIYAGVILTTDKIPSKPDGIDILPTHKLLEMAAEHPRVKKTYDDILERLNKSDSKVNYKDLVADIVRYTHLPGVNMFARWVVGVDLIDLEKNADRPSFGLIVDLYGPEVASLLRKVVLVDDVDKGIGKFLPFDKVCSLFVEHVVPDMVVPEEAKQALKFVLSDPELARLVREGYKVLIHMLNRDKTGKIVATPITIEETQIVKGEPQPLYELPKDTNWIDFEKLIRSELQKEKLLNKPKEPVAEKIQESEPTKPETIKHKSRKRIQSINDDANNTAAKVSVIPNSIFVPANETKIADPIIVNAAKHKSRRRQ